MGAYRKIAYWGMSTPSTSVTLCHAYTSNEGGTFDTIPVERSIFLHLAEEKLYTSELLSPVE
jgi:hypothetical protein